MRYLSNEYDVEVSRIAKEFYESNKELYRRDPQLYWHLERVYQEREIHKVFYKLKDIKKDREKPET